MSLKEVGEVMNGQNDAAALIDDMAQPFLDLAERFEGYRLNGASDQDWTALLETNMFLWRFVANYLPSTMRSNVPMTMVDLLKRISVFMMRAGVELRENRDEELINRIIELNLNMCDQILALHDRTEGGTAKAA